MIKVFDYIVEKIGWGGIISIFLFLIIYAWVIAKKENMVGNSTYVKGLSLGLQQGVRGSYYLDYSFEVDGKTYKGSMKRSFCDECPKCRIPGDTLIVQYENGNPENNNLVVKIPE
jgi:hypothetical protein